MAKVLVVESSKSIADYVSEVLQEAGHVTMATSSSSEGLAIFQERHPELVLVNYFLTEGDGLTFLESLLRLAPGTAVVMVTGLGNENTARQAMRLGAFDYVVKGQTFFRDLPNIVTECLNHRQVKDKKAALDNMRLRLSAQTELAKWFDHNFKNILSATLGFMTLIEEANTEQTREKRFEYLNESLASLKTALTLLDRLGQMTGGSFAEDERSFSVAQAVDEAWGAVTGLLRNGPTEDFSSAPQLLENITFINGVGALPPQELAHKDFMTILEALIKNAIEAVSQTRQPTIEIRARLSDDYLMVSVSDNGRGMDEQVRRHAFEPFFSTKGRVGVGLSLTTVLALVTRHGGQVTVETASGRGTMVEFSYHLAPSI
ncbi:MAG: response regulator [Deltaproteobacteria bacterium]|jgi:signal transduction histidine kinase|nr:response regulator [Deltaproteobacteria bacterium]